MFNLHAQLVKDCFQILDLSLCRLLLLNDANYPWMILVPMRNNISEIYQLNAVDQNQLMVESDVLSRFMVKQFNPDKLNIAALGNLVPQLHIHHIARYQDDPVWPAPVWGKKTAKAYTEDEANRLIKLTKAAFNG